MSTWKCLLPVFACLMLAHPARAAQADTVAYAAPPSPFGMREAHGRNIAVFYKWAGVVTRMDDDPSPLQPWLDHPDFASLNLKDKAVAVNDAVNAYPDVSDEDNWGVADYWETPKEFFAKGGDCEDYAISKYAWLRYLGVPEDSLRLAMVYDRGKKELHMLLVVYGEDGQTLFLDNQVKTVTTRNDVARYWPLYSVNRKGWWIEQPRGKGRQFTQDVLARAATAAH
jgi:predicted transglutaminase-like cysteine proteinase